MLSLFRSAANFKLFGRYRLEEVQNHAMQEDGVLEKQTESGYCMNVSLERLSL